MDAKLQKLMVFPKYDSGNTIKYVFWNNLND